MGHFHHYNFDIGNGNCQRTELCDTLVIGGGGFKGVQYLGGLHYLKEHGHLERITTYCGTSVGSIICLLFLCGHTPSQQYDLLPLKKIFQFSTQPPYVHSLLPTVMPTYLDVQVTFEQLFKKTGKFFFVIAFNVTMRRQEIFSVITTPDYSVINAVLFSCAIPLGTLPRCVETQHVYMDGGIVNNLAVDVAQDFDFSERIMALCFRPRTLPFPTALPPPAPGLKELVDIVFSVPSRLLDKSRLEACSKIHRLYEFEADGGGVESIISLDHETKIKLFQQGYDLIKTTL